MTDFPAPAGLPTPPPFGWVVNPSKLTGNEARRIQEQCGISPFNADMDSDEPIVVAAYIAVAYARRLDPDRYPWDIALDIPMDDFRQSFPGDEDQSSLADKIAEAMERSIEAGEEPPNPS